MKIIVGLGNPEKKYEKTYHNLGFIAIDNVAAQLNATYHLKSSLSAYVAQGIFMGEKYLLVKPVTYMNLSGESVVRVLKYFDASPKDLLVMYDDIDIDKGNIRFRPHGSAGTHNGMRNIVLHIGTTEFPRVRIGSKPAPGSMPLVEYVLSKIPESEYDTLNAAIIKSASLALDFIKGATCDQLMQNYNGNN